MKKRIVPALACIFLAACASQSPIEASGFPLEMGTTRVYAYQAYTASPADPKQIVKATYELTETIVDTETISDYFIAHVRRDRKLLNSDPGWTQELSGQPSEFWYVRDGKQVYQSNLPLDTNNLKPDQLILDYQFPLAIRESWCLLPDSRNSAKEIAGCEFVGKREVTGYGAYQTPAGAFDTCYDIMDV